MERTATIGWDRESSTRYTIWISQRIVRRLNLKPIVRIQNGEFVAHLEGCRYRLGETPGGIASALGTLRSVCGADRLALEASDDGEPGDSVAASVAEWCTGRTRRERCEL